MPRNAREDCADAVQMKSDAWTATTIEVAHAEGQAAAVEGVGDGEGQHQVPRHAAQQDRPLAQPARRDRVRQPRVAAVHPPDQGEHDHDLAQRLPRQVVGQHRGELRDREDEDEVEEQLERGDALHRAALSSTVVATAGEPSERARRPDAATLRRVPGREIHSWLMDMDGVLVHEEHAIPGADRFLDAAARARAAVPRPHQQLDLHAAATCAARLRASGLDVPEESIWTSALATASFLQDQRPGGSAFVDRRGRPDHRAARGRLHADRARPRLRRARRDAHLQLRAHHAGDPPDRQRRALHRHQPRPDRPVDGGAAPRDRRRSRR